MLMRTFSMSIRWIFKAAMTSESRRTSHGTSVVPACICHGTFREATFSAHSGNVQCTFRECSVHIQGTFSAHSGKQRSVRIQGMFSAHSGNVQCTCRERSVHIQGTFIVHSGNV
jgi:hypothetical protein